MTVEDTVAGPTRVMLVALPLMSWGLERLLEGDHGRWSVVGVVMTVVQYAHKYSDENRRAELFAQWGKAEYPEKVWREDFIGQPLRVRLSPLLDPFLVARYKDAADVEDHAPANHACSRHAKAPPEASDGVTLVIKSKRGENTPRRGISPGAP